MIAEFRRSSLFPREVRYAYSRGPQGIPSRLCSANGGEGFTQNLPPRFWHFHVPDPENFWADREIRLHTLADGSLSRSPCRRERQIRRLECCNELGQFWLFRSADSTPRIVEAAIEYLWDAGEALAGERGLKRIEAGVNLNRSDGYRQMLRRGFRNDIQGVAMHKPDAPAYNRPEVLVVDYWR